MLAAWIDGGRHRLALRLSEVHPDTGMSIDLNVGAQVKQRCQAAIPVTRPSDITEGPGLEGAPALVPEVVPIPQPQRVYVGSEPVTFSEKGLCSLEANTCIFSTAGRPKS